MQDGDGGCISFNLNNKIFMANLTFNNNSANYSKYSKH